MEILPKDFNKNIRELSEWLDKWRVERFGSDSLNPERYYKVTQDEKGRYLYVVAEGASLNDEKAKCDKVRDLLLSIKQINDKLSGKGLSQHLQWKEREQLKRERETLYKDYLEEVQTEPEPQRAMPEELNTEDAKELLDRLYKAGYKSDQIMRKLDVLENRDDYIRKYRSPYLCVRNWLKEDYKKVKS